MKSILSLWLLPLTLIAVLVSHQAPAESRLSPTPATSVLLPSAFESQTLKMRAGEKLQVTLPRMPTAYVFWVDGEDIRAKGLVEKVKTSYTTESLELHLNIALSDQINSGETFKITVYQLDPLSDTVQILMTNELIIEVE